MYLFQILFIKLYESLFEIVVDAFSPYESETASICGLGDFLIELWLMKMTSLSLTIDVE